MHDETDMSKNFYKESSKGSLCRFVWY